MKFINRAMVGWSCITHTATQCNTRYFNTLISWNKFHICISEQQLWLLGIESCKGYWRYSLLWSELPYLTIHCSRRLTSLPSSNAIRTSIQHKCRLQRVKVRAIKARLNWQQMGQCQSHSNFPGGNWFGNGPITGNCEFLSEYIWDNKSRKIWHIDGHVNWEENWV